MAQQNITVVFVPGAWHSPTGFDGVIGYLQHAGYKTSKVWTPSVVRDGAAPITSMVPDIEEVRKHLKEATDAGQKVVLVMHSYAGIPGTEAVKGFDQATLAAQGHKDGRGVIHLVYIAAFMLRKGENIFTLSGGPADWVKVLDDGTSLPLDPAGHLYNDFESKEEVDRWAADLKPWSIGTFGHEVDHEPWKTIPTTYLSCELDNAVPVASQKSFIGNAIGAGACDLRSVNWKCGHTPFGIKPLEISQLIRAAVGDR